MEIVYSESMALECTELAAGEQYYGYNIINVFGGVYQPDAEPVAVTPD